jgi:hypothetical protein
MAGLKGYAWLIRHDFEPMHYARFPWLGGHGVLWHAMHSDDLLTSSPGLVPQMTYYGRVGLELGKLIAHQRSMAPP